MADQIFIGTCPVCKYKYDDKADLRDECGIDSIKYLKHCNIYEDDTPIVSNSQEIFLNSPEVKARFNGWVDKLSKDLSYNVQVVSKSWLNDDLVKMCMNWSFKWRNSIFSEELTLKVSCF